MRIYVNCKGDLTKHVLMKGSQTNFVCLFLFKVFSNTNEVIRETAETKSIKQIKYHISKS